MRQLQLVAHGEPSDVVELNTVSEPTLGQEDVLVSMEAAPMNPSDFLFIRGIYGVRPAFDVYAVDKAYVPRLAGHHQRMGALP